MEPQLYNEAAMEALRQIPPINDILRSAELDEFRAVLGQPFASTIVNSVIADVRQQIKNSPNGASRAALTTKIATEVARRLRASMQYSLRRVINASGVVLHTNLGRAPLPEAAIDHLKDVSSGYSNLEFDIEQGARGKRDVHVAAILQELLGCESAVVVNNNAAAVLLVLNTLGEGGEVVVSRGEQVEIGESFRIPDILARSGCRLREVGSTNRTRIKDYESAINDQTRLLLRVHPSNFRIIGFTERPSLDEFVGLGRRRNIPTFEDLGSGCVIDFRYLGIDAEPVVSDSIRGGVDIVSFSGDKLLGGPQAGIIAGKKMFIDRVRRNPLFRALRVDKLTIAVLEHVLRTYLRGDTDEIPTLKLLNTAESELEDRAKAFAQKAGVTAQPIRLDSVIGGGSAPETYLPSWGVALQYEGRTASETAEQFRRSDPPVIVRIEDGRVILDFRTVFASELTELLAVVKRIASQE
jgi:L-seryl-tRNA(Ser) seleniumtransferase